MLVFPNAKINIGLNVVEKRSDGYHNIETVSYPVCGLYDALEAVAADEVSLTVSGFGISGNDTDNLVVKAYRLLNNDFGLPPLAFYLKKVIPMGAGLGGGSADASFTLKALNTMFTLGLSEERLERYALQLGADCPFFVGNRPAFAQGKGECLTPIGLDLRGKYLLLAKPAVSVGTGDAYGGVVVRRSEVDLRQAVLQPLNTWRDTITNAFEKNIFARYPILSSMKDEMYRLGAVYAAMSGSGSTIYGIFDHAPQGTVSGSCFCKVILL